MTEGWWKGWWLRAAALAVLGSALLGGCTPAVNAEESRTCRSVVAALDPDGPAEIVRVEPGAERATVRVEYRVRRPDGLPGLRRITCRFAPSALVAGRTELSGVDTARGPLTGASLYLLRRYYLDTPDAGTDGPAPDGARGELPSVSPALALALQVGSAGAPRIAVYSLLSAAYALVFGLVRRINLAFGEIAALGAAAAIPVALAGGGPGGLVVGVATAAVAAGLYAAAIGRVTLGLVSDRASLIATVGAALALAESLRLLGGHVPLWLPPLGGDPVAVARAGAVVVTVSPMRLGLAAAALGAALLLPAFLARSRFGRAWRAWSDDPRAAALFGIDGSRLLLATLALAGAAAGLAGVTVAILYGSFGAGFSLGLKALAAAILGGIGSVGGALAGALLIGIVETAWEAAFPIAGRDLAIHALLVLAIVLRPNGLFADPR